MYLDEFEEFDFNSIKLGLVQYMEKLIDEFDRYIPDKDLSSAHWIRNPFDVEVGELSDDVPGLQEELIELQTEEMWRRLHSKESLGQFWTQVKQEKRVIGTEAVKVLIPFSTTYLCEQGFSALTVMKTKSRHKLDPQHDLRLTLTKLEPQVDDIMKKKNQFHASH